MPQVTRPKHTPTLWEDQTRRGLIWQAWHSSKIDSGWYQAWHWGMAAVRLNTIWTRVWLWHLASGGGTTTACQDILLSHRLSFYSKGQNIPQSAKSTSSNSHKRISAMLISFLKRPLYSNVWGQKNVKNGWILLLSGWCQCYRGGILCDTYLII